MGLWCGCNRWVFGAGGTDRTSDALVFGQALAPLFSYEFGSFAKPDPLLVPLFTPVYQFQFRSFLILDHSMILYSPGFFFGLCQLRVACDGPKKRRRWRCHRRLCGDPDWVGISSGSQRVARRTVRAEPPAPRRKGVRPRPVPSRVVTRDPHTGTGPALGGGEEGPAVLFHIWGHGGIP